MESVEKATERIEEERAEGRCRRLKNIIRGGGG